MSKHLPKTSMHLEDEDVKIWHRDPDGDGDVKIWRRPGSGEKLQRAQTEDTDELEYSEESEFEPELEREPLETSRRGAKHDRELTARRLIQVIASAALLAAAVALPTDGLLRMASFALPLIVAGFDLLLDAVEDIFDGRVFNEALLICLAAVAAFVLGAYVESVLIVLLLRAERLLEALASEKSREAMEGLRRLRAGSASVETAEGLLSVSPDYVNVGDIIVVDPGERFPLDGIIIEGISDIDTRDLTGEEEPVNAGVGGRVFAGTVNLTRTVRVRVTSKYKSSTANRVLRFVRGSVEADSKLERFAEGFGRIFRPVALLAALALAIVPSLSDGQWGEWCRRAVILLAVSGTGILSAAVSLAYSGALGFAAKNGVLVNGPDCLETLSKTATMVFDKTGTITEGIISITDVFPVGISQGELIAVAAAAEKGSSHPIAQALTAACDAPLELEGDEPETEDIPGRGVSALVKGRQVYVGNAALLEEHGIRYAVPGRSGAAIHVAIDGTYCGHIMIADKIRAGAYDAMESLRTMGVKKLVMLTGDVLSVARPIASRLNFDMVRAELTPGEKAATMAYLMKNRGDSFSVAFIGDMLSDAEALETADLGIAMGALKNAGETDSADMLVMGEDIRALPLAFSAARRACGIARLDAAALLLEKLAAIVLGAAGLLPLGIAVAADAAFSVAALLNSLRSLNVHTSK